MSTISYPATPSRDDGLPGGIPSRSTLRVFVVDEDEPVTQLLALALGIEGWSVTRFSRGRRVVDAVLEDAPDAILLDMMLPDMTGMDVVAEIRRARIETPVLFLTGRSTLDDRLAAYAAGADDYITKPFGFEDVVGRLTEVFRKQGKLDTSVVRGDLVLDIHTRQVWLGGIPLMLAPMDFVVVLELALSAAGRMTRRALVDVVTDAGYDFVAPNDLMDIPAVTGVGPGGMRSAILRVSGSELVLMDQDR